MHHRDWVATEIARAAEVTLDSLEMDGNEIRVAIGVKLLVDGASACWCLDRPVRLYAIISIQSSDDGVICE